MSSLRNAVKTQKVHRERSQPAARAHLGPLEKKKDYTKRARTQENKKRQLKNLYKKALNKNPDEFNFHMINSRLKEGVHYENVQDEKICITNLKADILYVKHRSSLEKKKIDKLQANLHLLGLESLTKPQNTHILFVDTEEEVKKADVAKMLDTDPSLIKRPFNRLTTSQLSKLKLTAQDSDTLKIFAKEKNRAYKELSKRMEREKKLNILKDKLEVRKQLMDRKNKGSKACAKPKLISQATKDQAAVYLWPQERQK